MYICIHIICTFLFQWLDQSRVDRVAPSQGQYEQSLGSHHLGPVCMEKLRDIDKLVWVDPSFFCYNLTYFQQIKKFCTIVLIFDRPFRWYLYTKIISFQSKVCNFHYRTIGKIYYVHNVNFNANQFDFSMLYMCILILIYMCTLQ